MTHTDYTKFSKKGLLRQILDRLHDLIEGKEKIMGLLEDLQTALDSNTATLDSISPVIDAIAADEAALKQQIADLIAAGSGVTPAQLQGLLDKATVNANKSAAIKAALDAVDTSVP